MAAEHDHDPLNFRPGFVGGESILTVRNYRVERFIRKLERECREDDLVIAVTHWDWILACRSLLEDLDPFAFKQMYRDPKQRIHNLDAVCYSRRDAESGATEYYGHPICVGRIHLPSEDTPLDAVEPIRWQRTIKPNYKPSMLDELSLG